MVSQLNPYDHSTYEFTLAIQFECAVLVSVRRVLESRKVKARTEERQAAYAAGRAGVNHSRLILWSGSLEKRRQKQHREIERPWFHRTLKTAVHSPAMDHFSPRAFVPQVMSYPSTVTWSLGTITALFSKLKYVRFDHHGEGANRRVIEKNVEF